MAEVLPPANSGFFESGTAGYIARETQKATRDIAKIPKKKRNGKRIEVIADVDEVLEAIKKRLADESSLFPAVVEIRSDCEKLKSRLKYKDSIWFLQHLPVLDTQELTQKLSYAVQNLKRVRPPGLQQKIIAQVYD